ncbi:MAG: hypothetical protein U9R72_03175 [Chloroflexota bacterium]|nr:hypothetical protein [Chloroflexota bacterium]
MLQSRPITTPASGDRDDERRWYLSLRRSFENLQALRQRIEGELIPGMIEEANVLAGQAVDHMSDEELAGEIDRRQGIYDEWVGVYWDEFIPFAHGIRLFGQVYNDALHPDDPYAFTDLLAGTEMASLARNRALEQMAATIREDPQLPGALRERLTHSGDAEIDEVFQQRMDGFVSRFGDLSCAMTGGTRCGEASDALIKILLEMASHLDTNERGSTPPSTSSREARDRSRSAMRDEYLDQFEGQERERAAELLDLARTSYQLRDDDNIYLGRIEAELLIAVEEGRQRLEKRDGPGTGWKDVGALGGADVASALRHPGFVPERSSEDETTDDFVISAGSSSKSTVMGSPMKRIGLTCRSSSPTPRARVL